MKEKNKKYFKFMVIFFLTLTGSLCGDNVSELTKISAVNISQNELNKLATNLIVKYRFLSNVETDCPDIEGESVKFCYGAEIQLTTTEKLPVFAVNTNWQLNFSQVYPAYASQSDDFNLNHINGDLHQITPKNGFSGFKAGVTKKVKLWVKSTLITESELMPNYWLSAKNLKPALVISTKTFFDKETGLEQQPYVVPFTHFPKQIKSAPGDLNEYASANWLYDDEKNRGVQDTDLSHLPFAIIPTPKSLKILDNTQRLNLSAGIKLTLKGGLQLKHISAALDRLKALGIETVSYDIKEAVPIIIELNNIKSKDWRSGHYQLTINSDEIHIVAQETSGAFYALQSIAAILTVDSTLLPMVSIEDQPHYVYRGQHVDVARNFHSKEFIFSLIKQMAAYKLNKLHLHLADDEGWRLELPSLPELTAVASKRCMELSDKKCLQPQLGGSMTGIRDGFYTISDYQEILQMASKHHIQVIPSLDMPGHSRAAIKAMEARYRYYMQREDSEAAKRYLLTDFNDKTKYSSIQNYNDNTLNVCMESTYNFVDRVLEDLKVMHEQTAQPLTLYHIGADETAGAWIDSPICQGFIADKSIKVDDIKQLGSYFIERVAKMITDKGIAVAGWNDGLNETRKTNMPEQVYSYIWGALPWGAHEQVSEQAKRNWNIILSTPDVLYFDFPYQVDPKEPGYNWASRRITSQNIFNFMPDNLPIHAEFRVDTLGMNFVSDDRLQKNSNNEITHQSLTKNFTIDGIQGQLWSETVRSDQQAEYMIYPRLLALAERAWHKASWHVPYDHTGQRFDKNTHYFTSTLRKQRDHKWLQFSQTLGNKELAKMDLAGIFYRIPTVGAKVIENRLHANISIKGLPIEYREISGDWQRYKEPIAVTLPVKVRARTMDLKRAGRTLEINKSQ